MGQLARFRAPVDTDSAVLHLLSAGKEESGADKLIQSAVMVSNDADVLLLRERYLESEKEMISIIYKSVHCSNYQWKINKMNRNKKFWFTTF